MKQLIINKTPDKIGLDKLLWTRKTIQFASMQLLNVFMPLSTISYYMKNFGFSLQKPLKKAYEQNPKAVEDWIKKDYLEIKAKAKKEDAEIHWVDETRLRSNSNYIRGYSPKGKTPIIKNSAKRFGINIISSITNQGKMRFKTYKGSMNSQTLASFMSRLYSRNKHKIFVILDNLSVHHSKYFKNWLKNKKEKIEVFYLPPYSQELNPDERLNRDLKTNFNFGFNIKNSDDLRKKVRSFLRRIQKAPEKIKKYFISNFVRYAA